MLRRTGSLELARGHSSGTLGCMHRWHTVGRHGRQTVRAFEHHMGEGIAERRKIGEGGRSLMLGEMKKTAEWFMCSMGVDVPLAYPLSIQHILCALGSRNMTNLLVYIDPHRSIQFIEIENVFCPSTIHIGNNHFSNHNLIANSPHFLHYSESFRDINSEYRYGVWNMNRCRHR
jgi:hypothetical protein